jgi:hypothetical protein
MSNSVLYEDCVNFQVTWTWSRLENNYIMVQIIISKQTVVNETYLCL